MILRKPYAFLIRHFKLIHLLLLVPLCFIAYKTSNIVDFFNNMVASNYTTNEVNIASSYINIFLYLALIIVIATSVTIYYLMKEKGKRTFYYIFLIVYYILLFVCTTLTYGQMLSLENQDAVASTIRLFRDFAQILYYPQYLFILYTLFRGIGFDIKSFNFSKDLEDLELEDDDNEEVEIDFGKNSYKYKRQVRRTLREIKYYILENKFVFGCIVAVALISLFSTIYMSIEVYNKKYSLNQAFSINGLVMSVNDSLLTNLNYDGTKLADGKYYLAVKVAMANRSKKDISIDKDNFRLYIDKEYIYPELSQSNKFVDYASCFFGGAIKAGTSSEYVIVFELNEKQFKKNYTLRILDRIIYKVGEFHTKYKIINLRPTIERNIEDMGTIPIKQPLSFEATNLGKSDLVINDYYFDNSFKYTYEKCQNEECQEYNSSISTSSYAYLILDADMEVDDSSYYHYNKIWRKNFYDDFVRLKYEVDGKTYYTKMQDKTPERYKGDLKVFQVPKSLRNATNIMMEITVRNKKASIILANQEV